MRIRSNFQGAFRSAIPLLLAFGASGSPPTLAGDCGAYCKARMVRALCHHEAMAKAPDVHQRNLEFERCKVDPRVHEQVEQLTDNDMDGLD